MSMSSYGKNSLALTDEIWGSLHFIGIILWKLHPSMHLWSSSIARFYWSFLICCLAWPHEHRWIFLLGLMSYTVMIQWGKLVTTVCSRFFILQIRYTSYKHCRYNKLFVMSWYYNSVSGFRSDWTDRDLMKHIVKIITLLVTISALWIGLLEMSLVPRTHTWLVRSCCILYL